MFRVMFDLMKTESAWADARPALRARLRASLVRTLQAFNKVRFLEVPWLLRKTFLIHKVLQANGCHSLPPIGCSSKFEELPWAELCRIDPGLTGRPWAASVIQRRWRARAERRDAAARRIQQGCRRWIHEPRTRDGKLGINLRILMAMDVSG